jgi:hypothetical protein
MSQSQFPKMGEFPLVDSIGDPSALPSGHTTFRPRTGPAGDSESEPAGKRGASQMSGEMNGPKFRPQMTVSWPNDPAASQTGRGLRILPSVASRNGFWDQRADESGQVIA